MTRQYDVIIIGGGNAGFGVSAVAAEAGNARATKRCTING